MAISLTFPPLCDFNFEKVPVLANSASSCNLLSTFACKTASCLMDLRVALDTEGYGGFTLDLEVSVTVSPVFCDFLILLLTEVFFILFSLYFSNLFP